MTSTASPPTPSSNLPPADLIDLLVHDLGVFLTPLATSSQILLRSRNLGTMEDYLHKSIFRATSNALELVRDFADLRGLQSGQLSLTRKYCSPEALIQDCIEIWSPLAQSKSLSLISLVPSGLPQVWADGRRIQQVLSNLVGNAIKFSPHQEIIEIEASSPDPTHVTFSVRDSGPGIEFSAIDHVFSPFWRHPGASAPGAGLGLAIAKWLVEAHDGTIGVESFPGRGSVFRFTLPNSLPGKGPLAE